jgi:3-hydroxyacyl-CoA dehydrogenase
MRLWTLDGEVLIASIKTKVHLIGPGVIEGPGQGRRAGRSATKGLVIWSPDDPFSAGANLEAMLPVFMKGGAKAIAPEVKKLQDAMLRDALRHRADGGGGARHGAGRRLRAGVHCAAASRDGGLCRPGRSGRGPDPGGGGLTYIARRAAEMAAAGGANADLLPLPDATAYRRRDGQGGHQRAGVAQAGLPAR